MIRYFDECAIALPKIIVKTLPYNKLRDRSSAIAHAKILDKLSGKSDRMISIVDESFCLQVLSCASKITR
jgi:hypothetical protein